MLSLLKQSNLPEAKWTPPRLTAGRDMNSFRYLNEIRKDIVEWVNSGHSLYIYSGNYGNGKTSWGVKLLLAYFNSVWYRNNGKRRGVFVGCAEYVNRSRDLINYKDEDFIKLRRDILTCDLVIWDDISSSQINEFGHSLLLDAINTRCFAEKANVYTGNIGSEELLKSLGGRLHSRIWKNSEIVEFIEEDWRGTK